VQKQNGVAAKRECLFVQVSAFMYLLLNINDINNNYKTCIFAKIKIRQIFEENGKVNGAVFANKMFL